MVDKESREGERAAASPQATASLRDGEALAGTERHEEAIARYDSVIDRHGIATDRPLRELVLQALVKKAYALVALDRLPEAKTAFSEVRARLDATSNPERAREHLDDTVAKLLLQRAQTHQQAGRFLRAITTVDALEERGPAASLGRQETLIRGQLLKSGAFASLGRREDALAVLETLRQSAGREEPTLRALVADGLNRRARLLADGGQKRSALQAYSDALAEMDQEGLVAATVDALSAKAVLLIELGEVDIAYATAKELLARFATESQAELAATAASAIGRTAAAFRGHGATERAMALWDEIVGRYGDDRDSSIRRLVARALVERAELLAVSGQRSEAVVVADAAAARFGDELAADEPMLLARAIGTKGMALASEGRYEEAIDVFNVLVARFGDSPSLPLRTQCALALLNTAIALEALGRDDEAAEARRLVVARFGDAAVVAFDNNLEQFANASGPGVAEQIVSELFNKASVLRDLGRTDEALRATEELLERFDDDEHGGTRDLVVQASKLRDAIVEQKP